MKTPKFLKDLNRNSICYLESSLNYTLFYFDDGKKMISGYTIKVFEQIFDNQDFVKINRSTLVNIAFICQTKIRDNTYSIKLLNGNEITISRRRVNKIKEVYPFMFKVS